MSVHEPQASPTKRVLTEDLHTASKSQIASDNTTSEDLAARIRSRSLRVRQSVTEGYSSERGTSALNSPYASPTKSQPTDASKPQIFQSAKDILRDVYTQQQPGLQAARSPLRKRQRAKSEEPESTADASAGDAEMQMDDLDSKRHDLPCFTGFGPDSVGDGSRPIKPLRRSGRAFTQTRSLPVGSFKFSDESQSRDHAQNEGSMDTDDDWSEDPSFSMSTAPLQLDMEF